MKAEIAAIAILSAGYVVTKVLVDASNGIITREVVPAYALAAGVAVVVAGIAAAVIDTIVKAQR